MNLRANGSIWRVSDKHKKRLAKMKRDSGYEAIHTSIDYAANAVVARCLYTRKILIMPILKEAKS